MPEKSTETLASIAEKMRDLDIANLVTITEGGTLCGRPMSNNGDVEYDGNSYYFTDENTRMVADIGRNPRVQLGFQGDDQLHVSVVGQAEIIRDKAEFEAHWVPDLEAWFEDGVDTPGLVLIQVKAERIKYWKGEDSGEWQA